MPAAPLFLPVENQVRELDAKLLLACAAAERGFPVVLGSRPFLNFAMPHLPRGIFIAKSMRARSALMFKIMRALGHAIVAWDEESLVRFSSPEYYNWRFSPDTFSPLSHLFAWGRNDADMFTAYPGINELPVHITGNPRIDLLREDMRGYFEREVSALRTQHGDFILVNTNFSFVNAFVRRLNLVLHSGPLEKPALSRTGQGMSLEFARGLFEHQQAIFEGFCRLMPALAKRFPEKRIILRPHPSEDHALWEELTADWDNVQVIHEGNVAPWLMASRVLLHNGCTTAVEAAVLGVPAVTYQPVTSDCFDYELPNSLSHRAYTAGEVLDLTDAVLAGRLDGMADLRKAVLARHVSAIDGAMAADRILDVLEEAGFRESPPPAPHRMRATAARLVAGMRTAVKHVNMHRHNHWNSAAYHAHIFPEIAEPALDARIARLGRQLARFEGLKARRIGRHLFRIDGPGNASAGTRLTI